MNTIILRRNWIEGAASLTDKQFREYITKLCAYGFGECCEGVDSSDRLVNALLDIVKPAIEKSVYKYLELTS